ncbi:caveolae-associated protein 4b [Brienomyrus brachyistius]|uniref:caveolae-associated protein 4b n=1 Tax=Brienomyrus brachyistius TaxID=42636 RepID=UPI0020B29553|nr:caveolae-associated protein 4b [Brienomyrus brachyistius]
MDPQQYRMAKMADRLQVSAAEEDTGNPNSSLTILSLLERVAGIIDNVQACQQRMEERQLELENTVKIIQTDVLKLTKDHATTSSTVEKLLEKTRKVSTHIKDVRVRIEKQNLRVKKVEETQGELLMKNKFRVVIYQGDKEVPAVDASKAPKEVGSSGTAVEPDTFEVPPDSDEEYMVVEEADSSAAARIKKTGLKRIESLKATFSRENLSKTRENLGTKVSRLGERIVPPERRERIRQSGERFKETITKTVPAKLNLKKERTVAEGQEGAEGATEATAPIPPPKGRKANPDVTYTEVVTEPKGVSISEFGARRREGARMDSGVASSETGRADEVEVPVYDMKQLS